MQATADGVHVRWPEPRGADSTTYNGVEMSHRLLVWNGSRISEEHDTNGAVTKRFFAQGVQFITGTNAGIFYYTRDHLGSIRELTDASGNVRARYAYDPFGRRTKVSGDVDADFGFAGMFWSSEANLSLTHFRAYDPDLGRWLSRDPLSKAEMHQGPNLYSYVGNEPVNRIDPKGLCFDTVCAACAANPEGCALLAAELGGGATIINELEQNPEAEAAVADVVECAQNVSVSLNNITLPEWSDTITGLEDTVPAVESLVPDSGEEIEEAEDVIENSDWARKVIEARLNLPEWANVSWWNTMSKYPASSWWYSDLMKKLSEGE